MFGWLRCTPILASWMNSDTKRGLPACSSLIRLMTSRFSNPATPNVRASNTSAMPPVPISSSSSYFPNGAGSCTAGWTSVLDR